MWSYKNNLYSNYSCTCSASPTCTQWTRPPPPDTTRTGHSRHRSGCTQASPGPRWTQSCPTLSTFAPDCCCCCWSCRGRPRRTGRCGVRQPCGRVRPPAKLWQKAISHKHVFKIHREKTSSFKRRQHLLQKHLQKLP